MNYQMITCKLCNTRLEKKNLRRDGSMLCPVCGQVYWKAAVEAAGTSSFRHHSAEERMAEYARQSRLSVEMLRARLA
jgi:uncharacterized Zn finger protein (UPF0148 family)